MSTLLEVKQCQQYWRPNNVNITGGQIMPIVLEVNTGALNIRGKRQTSLGENNLDNGDHAMSTLLKIAHCPPSN